jgi:LysM repeat protein
MNNDPLPTTSYTPTFYTQTLDPVGIAAPTNVANGTRTLECGYYYDVESGDTLASIASDVQLNASVLETWNPQLASAAPIVGTSLCVRFPTGNYTLANATRPANAAPKTGSCAQWHTVVTGDTCATIETTFNLTSAQFSQLNREQQRTPFLHAVADCLFSGHQRGLHDDAARRRVLRPVCLRSWILDRADSYRTSGQPGSRVVLELHSVSHCCVGRHVQLDGGRCKHFSDGSPPVEPRGERDVVHEHPTWRGVLCRRRRCVLVLL